MMFSDILEGLAEAEIGLLSVLSLRAGKFHLF